MRSYTFHVIALLAAVLLLCLAFFVITGQAAPNRAAGRDAAVAEAAAMLKKGDAAQAYALYMNLLRELPDDDAVALGLARSATKARRWNQAVAAYEILLEKYPHDAGLYGELAQVYMQLGDREGAERSASMLRSLNEKITREETDQALDLLESRYSNFQMHGKVQGGILYDTNANLGPYSNTMDLGGWPVQVKNAKEQNTFGAYLGANVDLGWRFFRDSPWWLVGDAQGFWRGNLASELNDTHNRESQWGRGSVGLRHLTSSILAEVRFKGEIFDYEFYQHVAAYGPEGTLLWAYTPTLHFLVKGGLDKRDYSKDAPRDGLYGWAGLYSRAFFGADNHELLVGGRYLGANADKGDYGYYGWEATARLLVKLPCKFELSPFFSYTREDYKGPATVLETDDRLDKRARAGLDLTYRINELWAVECGWQYTKNKSSSALYTYDQQFIHTGAVWSF